jgi:hypothetical protein
LNLLRRARDGRNSLGEHKIVHTNNNLMVKTRDMSRNGADERSNEAEACGTKPRSGALWPIRTGIDLRHRINQLKLDSLDMF